MWNACFLLLCQFLLHCKILLAQVFVKSVLKKATGGSLMYNYLYIPHFDTIWYQSVHQESENSHIEIINLNVIHTSKINLNSAIDQWTDKPFLFVIIKNSKWQLWDEVDTGRWYLSNPNLAKFPDKKCVQWSNKIKFSLIVKSF